LRLATIINDDYFERFFFHRIPKGIVGVIQMRTLFCIGPVPYPKLDIGKICFTESTSVALGTPQEEKIAPMLQEV
jgi:hypothetical protein